MVDRRRDDDAVPRFGQMPEQGDDPSDDVGGGHHLFGVDRPGHVPFGEAGEGAGQVASGGIRVAGVVDLDRVDQRLLDRPGEGEVHLGDERRQHTGREVGPLGAAPPAQIGDCDFGKFVDHAQPD